MASEYSLLPASTLRRPTQPAKAALPIADIVEGMIGTETPYVVVEDRREAIRFALNNAESGDVVVLAGKGHETYQIVGTQKIPLDEREVVAAYFAEKNKS